MVFPARCRITKRRRAAPQRERSALSKKRAHGSGGTVQGDESDDPIIALMRMSICRSRGKDYLNLAYLGRPPEQLSAAGGGGFA